MAEHNPFSDLIPNNIQQTDNPFADLVPEEFSVAKPIQQDTQEPIAEKPKTLSEKIFNGLRSVGKNIAETPERILGIGETAVNVTGNLATSAVAGLAGIGESAIQSFSAGDPQARSFGAIGIGDPLNKPKEEFIPDPNAPADVVKSVQQFGQEAFRPKTKFAGAAQETLGAGVEKVGEAIKFPLSAVPFAIGGTEERNKFVELPISQYLGELAQDSGASPLFATLASLTPDIALIAAGGRAAKGVPRGTKPPKVPPPTIEQLKSQANTLYDIVDNSGIRISDDAFRSAVDRITQDAASKGVRQSLTPKTVAALDELALEAKAGGLTLKKSEELRRVIKKAQTGIDADVASASRVLAEYDKFIQGLTKKDLSGAVGPETAEYLKSARGLWSRARKTEQVEDMIDIAGLNAGQFTGSGFENALRLQFRALARNKKKIKLFTSTEQKAIRAVAFGTKTGNILRQIGKLAPTGVVSAGVGSGAGFLIAGPAGAIAVPAVGSISRFLATRSTLKAADKVSDLTRRGPQ